MFSLFFEALASSLPSIIWAVIILFIGLIISDKAHSLTSNFLDKLKVNYILKSLGWQSFLNRFDTKLNISSFYGLIIQIYIILLFLIVSLDILSLSALNNILEGIINYYPNIFISMIIFVFAVYLADFSKKIIIGNFDKETVTYSNLIGNVASTATWILSILAILYQLQIVHDLVLIVFIGFISMIVIILGISFGIGGKDVAARILEDLEKKIK